MTAPATPPAPPGYRPCVGILLIDGEGRIFVGERLDTPDAWQMPQGGIDEGETPEQAAVRELAEETGITSAELMAVAEDWLTYDLPPALAATAWGGRYRGQAQIWALFRFTGSEDEIDLDTDHREFRHWKWTDAPSLLEEIVEFKRDIYRAVVTVFADHIGSPSGD